MQAKEGLDAYLSDTLVNKLVESKVPSSCIQNDCVLGIDEAGRGPVLGPMTYAVAYLPCSNLKSLKQSDFRDSKTLTDTKRESLFEAIQTAHPVVDTIGYMVKILAPNMISNSMLRKNKYDLNSLSHNTAIDLIRSVQSKGIRVDHVYIDTVGPVIKYRDKLKSVFPRLQITVAEKADSEYPIVSVASVCAKVMRDRIIRDWKFIESAGLRMDTFNLGSGYPADPETKRFLEDSIDPVFGFTTIARFSWSTVQRLCEKSGSHCAWNEPDDKDSLEQKSNQKRFMKNHFKSKSKSSSSGSIKKAVFDIPTSKAHFPRNLDPMKPLTTADKFFQDRQLDRLMEIGFCK